MARLLTLPRSIFQPAALEGGTNITRISVQSTIKRSPGTAYKITGDATNSNTYQITWSTGALGTAVFYREYVYFETALPANTTDILQLVDNSALAVVSLRLTTGGKLQVWDLIAAAQVGSDSTATLVADTWYAVELMCELNTGATDVVEGRVDGVSIASASNLNLSDNAAGIRRAGFGNISGALGTGNNMYIDDGAINDDTGATSQTSWPNTGGYTSADNHVAGFGVPISDNVVGSWVGGADGTTNLFEAVNNNPPIGEATETDLTQIENSINAGGTNYIANMETYTTIGVPAGATVKVTQAVVSTGEDVSTGTKTGQFKIATNPAGAFATITTFGSTALGTWPTNWLHYWTNADIDPSVTLGNSPTIEIEKTDTGTRVASCCFMGYVAEYVEAAGGVTVALTGVSATGAIGAFAVAVSLALGGLSGTGEVGTLAPSASYSVAVTGNQAAGSVGSLAAAAAAALSGEAATGSVGTLVPSTGGVAVAITGVQATGSPGNLSASVNVALTGNAATGSVGTLSPASGVVLAVTGVQATGAVGSLAAQVSAAVTGNAATGAVGTVSPSTLVQVALSGVEGTGSVGTLEADLSVALSGIAATGSVGNLGPSVAGAIQITGVFATGSVGTLTPGILSRPKSRATPVDSASSRGSQISTARRRTT